jgi:16S rRNA processing protein RimM
MNIKNTKNNPASKNQIPGSPEQGEPVFLSIGKLRRAHGLGGEILMDVNTHFPDRIKPGKTYLIGAQHSPMQVETVRWANKNVLIKFVGINSPEEMAILRNQIVFINSQELPQLPEGEYYHHQILGLQVFNESGEKLGNIDEILETGANDVYVVKQENGEELLLPVIFDVVLSYHLDEGKIIVRLPEFL